MEGQREEQREGSGSRGWEVEVEGGQRLKPKLQLESNTKALRKNPVAL